MRVVPVAVVALLSANLLAGVTVLQVEADGDTGATGFQYAPVDFTASPLVSGGITYHALSGLSSGTYSTLSGHAQGVRSSMTSYAGTGVISNIYAQYAGNFYSTLVSASSNQGTGGAYLMRPPVVPGNGVQIINHSWIGTASFSTEATTRAWDHMIAANELSWFAGAVNSGTNYAAWIPRNGLAVRGSQSFTLGTQTLRTHADVWGPGLTAAASNTTPQVASIAAKIINHAESVASNARRHEVVKSIVMTGTDKTAFGGNFTSWSPMPGTNIDRLNGVGRVVQAQADAIYAAGEKALTPLTSRAAGTAITTPTVASTPSGWSYISSISEGDVTSVVVYRDNPFDRVTATLAWDIGSPIVTFGGQPAIDTGVDLLANLDLRMHSVTRIGDNYTLGSAISLTGLSSTTADDNVEHLYYSGATELSPGYYAFVIDYADTPSLTNYSVDAGFSFSMNVVPEPGSLALVGLAVGIMLRRARRAA